MGSGIEGGNWQSNWYVRVGACTDYCFRIDSYLQFIDTLCLLVMKDLSFAKWLLP